MFANAELTLAVCSWSLRPDSPAQLTRRLAQVGLRRVQLALNPLVNDPATWGLVWDLFDREGITAISGMFAAVGEDYSTLDSIRRTGGLVPDETWPENLRLLELVAEEAERMALRLVTLHAGFIPPDPQSPIRRRLADRLCRVAELFHRHGLVLGLETGQESAGHLHDFLWDLHLPNVGVNFDPANMILYGMGDPVEAVQLLGPWIRQCHVKDARATLSPGTWGTETPVGDGDVPWPTFLESLLETGFRGALVIEREAHKPHLEDIVGARKLVRSLVPVS